MRIAAASLCALALACAGAKPAPQAAQAPRAPVPLDEYFKARRYGALSLDMSFSHDDRLAAFQSDAGGRLDLWVKPLDGGPARQVTRVEGFIGKFAFSPADDVLAYEADVGGDELPHLFLTDSNGSAPRDVTADYPKGRRTRFVQWAPDGKTFLYLSNLRDEKLLDFYEYDLASGRSHLLWIATGSLAFGAADRAHLRFVLRETLSDKDSNLWLFERGEEQPILLTRHRGDVLYQPLDFTQDGNLLFTSDQEGEYTGLYSMDLATKRASPLAQQPWDVDSAAESLRHRYRYVAINADGTTRLSVQDLQSGNAVALPEAPLAGGWFPSDFSPGERYLGVFLRTDATPSTPYALDLQTGEARKLDEPLTPSLRGRSMVVGESVRVPSFDSKPVPAFAYRPPRDPVAAIILVHGGPTSQSRRTFGAFTQYLVSKGYAVLVPNVRGSTGYGKSWTRLDSHDLGGGPGLRPGRVRGQRGLLRRLGPEDAGGGRPDEAAAARRPGRPRPPGHQGAVGSHRRGAARAEGAGGIPGAGQRGPRLLAHRQHAARVRRHRRIPGSLPARRRGTMTGRVRFDDHQGRRILITDLSDLDPDRSPIVLDEARRLVATLPKERSLLSLLVVRKMRFDPRTIDFIKQIGRANEPWVMATPVVGLTAIGRVVARVVSTFNGRRYAAFETVEQAKEWLVRQTA